MLIIHAGVQLSGFSPPYSIGDSVSITCSTDLKVERIVWLNADGQEVSIATGAASLTLNFNSVTQSLIDAEFTCRAESELGTQTMAIVLEVEGSSSSGLPINAIVGAVIGGLLLTLVPAAIVIILCFCARKKPR